MRRARVIVVGVALAALTSDFAGGQTPLRNLTPDQIVREIRHCQREYRLTMATGERRRFREFDLRFKTDSGPTGPERGKPVLLRAGMQSDRAQVIFSGLDDLKTFLVESCEGDAR